MNVQKLLRNRIEFIRSQPKRRLKDHDLHMLQPENKNEVADEVARHKLRVIALQEIQRNKENEEKRHIPYIIGKAQNLDLAQNST